MANGLGLRNRVPIKKPESTNGLHNPKKTKPPEERGPGIPTPVLPNPVVNPIELIEPTVVPPEQKTAIPETLTPIPATTPESLVRPAAPAPVPEPEKGIGGLISKVTKPVSDWYGKLAPKEQKALATGLGVAGLKMMEAGGRAYPMGQEPSTIGVLGTAGLAGVAAGEAALKESGAEERAGKELGLKEREIEAKIAKVGKTINLKDPVTGTISAEVEGSEEYMRKLQAGFKAMGFGKETVAVTEEEKQLKKAKIKEILARTAAYEKYGMRRGSALVQERKELVEPLAQAVIDGDADINRLPGMMRALVTANLAEKGYNMREYGATTDAVKGALSAVEKRRSLTNQVLGQADTMLKIANDESSRYVRGQYSTPNKLWNALRTELTDPATGRFKIATMGAGREYMKVVTGSAGSVAELSVGAQETIDTLLKTSNSWQEFDEKVKLMRKELSGVAQSFDNEINALKGQLRIGATGRGMPETNPSTIHTTLPPANQYTGKVAKDQKTDKRYKSDGNTWVEIK